MGLRCQCRPMLTINSELGLLPPSSHRPPLSLLTPAVQERRCYRAGGLREGRQGVGHPEEGQRGVRLPPKRRLHQSGTGKRQGNAMLCYWVFAKHGVLICTVGLVHSHDWSTSIHFLLLLILQPGSQGTKSSVGYHSADEGLVNADIFYFKHTYLCVVWPFTRTRTALGLFRNLGWGWKMS